MAILEFKNVTKHYGKVTALKNVSFKTADGEFLVILGPSGAGKSTTLKIICGLVNPSEGKVYLDGEDITKVPPYTRNISMTFENYSLYPHMTVFNNMAYPLRAKKGEFTEAQIKGRIESVAKMLHIEPLLDRFPSEASGGQKQRIALGRTMVRNPKIYLLDEPLAHLDAKIRVELREEFHKIEALQKTTTIYVTHDYIEALSLGDRIMIYNEGELLQIGTPDEVYNHPNNYEVARQVGQPAINAVPCAIASEGGKVRLRSEEEPSCMFDLAAEHQALLKSYAKDRVTLGIRPKNIGVIPESGAVELGGTVDVFQPLGSEGVLTSLIGKLSLVGLIDPEAKVKHEDKVRLFLDKKAFYFFDPDTTKNLMVKN
jgi:multiple sugar transport system ATP-binding protein